MMNDSQVTIVAAMTCYNRADKTVNCIKRLIKGNPLIEFDFVVVDDNSNDLTVERLKALNLGTHLHLIETEGNLYYSRGMKKALDYILSWRIKKKYDYLILLNDDVEFFAHSIENIIEQSKRKNDAVIVGTTCSQDGKLTYGGVKYVSRISIKTKKMGIDDSNDRCDTFNANCVIVPYSIFLKVGSFDSHYIHSLGDYDYGLAIRNSGSCIFTSEQYCGICENNPLNSTWMDRKLTRVERIKRKENPKGAPTKQWFYFLNKNFGICRAVLHTVLPYIKILAGC